MFYKKILFSSVTLGLLFIMFMHYDLLRAIPGFYCESFGCIGNGLYYIFIALILIPIIHFMIGYFFTKESKLKNAFKAFAIAFGVMMISLILVFGWNNIDNNSAVQKAVEDEVEFWEALGASEETPKQN